MNPQRPTAQPFTPIQIVEQQIAQYAQQETQALAQLHATQGALMASQQLLARLRAEENKALKAESYQALAGLKDAIDTAKQNEADKANVQ
jgi:hypothetical protein